MVDTTQLLASCDDECMKRSLLSPENFLSVGVVSITPYNVNVTCGDLKLAGAEC
jgi:hypothetical protein